MKWKAILFLAIVFSLVFVIYLTTLDRKVYYLNLGDEIALEEGNYGEWIRDYIKSKGKLEKYVSEFSEEDYRTTDFIRDIKDNRKVFSNGNNIALKNALIKADLVTLSIGSNDIYYKITTSSPRESYEYMDQVLVDLEQLLELIREYCKEDIVMINYYNTYQENYNEIFEYMNDKLEDLANVYEIQIVNIRDIMYNNTMENRLPNIEQYEQIYNCMKKIIDRQLFH